MYRRYKRRFNRYKSGKYNKFQKKAYARKRKSYKNRQQLLSIKTVKAIAKKVSTQVPETKFKVVNNYDGVGVFNRLINGPTDIYAYSACLLNNADIPIGTGEGQRIGKEIFFKGIKLNAVIRGPRICNISMTDTLGGMSTLIQFHVKIVYVRKGEASVPGPPDTSQNVPENLYINARDLALQEKDSLSVKTVYHKTYTMKPKVIEMAVASDAQTVQPLVYVLKKYIPINKKLRFLSTTNNDWKGNYFLWVYAYNINHSMAGGTNWGALENYSPRFSHTYTAYYTDS